MATKKKNTKNRRKEHPPRSFVAPDRVETLDAAVFEQLDPLYAVDGGIQTVEQLHYYLPQPHAADLEHYFSLGRAPRDLSARSKSRREATERCLNGYGNSLRRLFCGDVPSKNTERPFGIFSQEENEQIDLWIEISPNAFRRDLNFELFEYLRNRMGPAANGEPYVAIAPAKLERFFRVQGIVDPKELLREMLAHGDVAWSTWGEIRIGAEQARHILKKNVRKIRLSDIEEPSQKRDLRTNQVDILRRFRELVRGAALGGRALPDRDQEVDYRPEPKELASIATSVQRLRDAALNNPTGREARWLEEIGIPADSALANGVRIRANGVPEPGEGEPPPRLRGHPTTTVTEIVKYLGLPNDRNQTIRQELVKLGCPNADKVRGEIPTAWLRSERGREFWAAIDATIRRRSTGRTSTRHFSRK